MPQRYAALACLLALAACDLPTPGVIEGAPELTAEGCTSPDVLVCRVESELRFLPDEEGALVWRNETWRPGAEPVGTTDGASIPPDLWDLIGQPYDPLFVRPAILHDHYTWPANRYRPWREVHRMFLSALLAEGVDERKAFLMYYAVFVFGGHWAILELPEEGAPPEGALAFAAMPACDAFCAETYGRFDGRRIHEEPTLQTDRAARELLAVWALLNDPSSGLIGATRAETEAALEELARQRFPDNPFLQYGETIPLTREIAECFNLIPSEAMAGHGPL